MTRWRVVVATILLGGFALPLALPLFDLLRQPDAWQAWDDAGRFRELAANTLLLIGGTLALTLPVGITGAVLLYRSDLPGRRFFRFLTLLTLFVPLPLFASAWQAALGTGGWLPLAAWTTGDPDSTSGAIPWKPWAQGLPAAIWVHACAGLPWVVWIVGQGLSWVERELEEDALLCAPPLRVLWSVTLPRCRAAIFAASLWVALQSATEITITDMMQVRTFAEEVYTQFVFGRQTLARAVAVSLPSVVLLAGLAIVAAQRWERTLPPLEGVRTPGCLLSLGRWRWFWLPSIGVVVSVLVVVPLASLIWKAGLGGSPESWSMSVFWQHVVRVPEAHGRLLFDTVMIALLAGILAAALALVSAWLATEARWFHAGLLGLMAVAWAVPGPVAGIGLKETINLLMTMEEKALGLLGFLDRGPLRIQLYDGPSLWPVLWATLLRFFPYAAAMLWSVVRLVPAELRDSARVDGARPWQELCFVIGPMTARECLRAALAIGVLSLGELAAGKLVETPGASTFSHEVFNQMHYGVTGNLAGLCLVLLGMVALGGSAVALASRSKSSA
ncbi:MAG: ABC transporter permease subunit [Gemmataceae bacterium]|nr:ABC transporter permease subunit [Gemmataceae bacterium]